MLAKQHLASRCNTGGLKLQQLDICPLYRRSALFGFYIGVFHFAHRFQLLEIARDALGDFSIL